MSMITIRELDKALNEMFDSVYSYSSIPNTLHYSSTNNENEIKYEVYACGATKEDVKVDIQENILTVAIEPKSKSVFSKPIKLSWRLSKDIDLDSVDAKLENGILNVRLSRVKLPKKSVSVSVN